ncbi:MAG: DUF4230 domain-containing protein [Bacteroidota bacterium]
MKNLLLLLGWLIAFSLGSYLTWQVARPAQQVTTSDATILLERVRKVCKLVTVEGDITETYKGGDIRNFTFYLPFPTTIPIEKQAVINVKGTVMVGYDLSQLTIEMDQENKIMRLGNLPEPSVLSVDHEISYYNLEESWFNAFEAKDFTRLNKEAKQKIREAAERGPLVEEAKTQGMQLFDIIAFMAQASGWTVDFEELPTSPSGILQD